MTQSEKIKQLKLEISSLKDELKNKELQKDVDEKWSQNIVDSLPNPLFIKNNKHQFVVCNQAFCEFVNLTNEDLMGKSDYDFFSKEQSDIFWEKTRKFLKKTSLIAMKKS